MMNKEEINQVLDELNQVTPEHLNEKAKRLFNAIMSIADERDRLQERIDKAIEYIEWQKDNATYDNIWRESEANILIKILNNWNGVNLTTNTSFSIILRIVSANSTASVKEFFVMIINSSPPHRPKNSFIVLLTTEVNSFRT